MDQPTAEHALRQLEPLVGEWTFEAKWLAESRGGAAEGSPSSDTPRGGTPAPACDGGAPEAPDNVSIIGCDPANGTYFQVYSDERGVCRIYEMSIGNQLASAGTTTGTSNTGTRSPASGLSDSTPTRRREDSNLRGTVTPPTA